MNNLVFLVLVAVLGAVAFYFFLRANPKKRAAIDAQVDSMKSRK